MDRMISKNYLTKIMQFKDKNNIHFYENNDSYESVPNTSYNVTEEKENIKNHNFLKLTPRTNKIICEHYNFSKKNGCEYINLGEQYYGYKYDDYDRDNGKTTQKRSK